MINGCAATRAWADGHADTMRRFAATIGAANHWANTHRADTLPTVSRLTKIPPEQLAHMMAHPWVESLDAAAVQPLLDIFTHYGALAESLPANQILFGAR